MQNIEVSVKGSKLVVEVDLSQQIGPSKSGKNILVATTGGNVVLSNGMSLGLNVYKRPNGKK